MNMLKRFALRFAVLCLVAGGSFGSVEAAVFQDIDQGLNQASEMQSLTVVDGHLVFSGFPAESSLDKAPQHYQMSASVTQAGQAVQPEAFTAVLRDYCRLALIACALGFELDCDAYNTFCTGEFPIVP